MLKPRPFVKIAELGTHSSVKAFMKQFSMDKDDRKYLIWFLVGLLIAAIPWILGVM